jgi:hypothetical protein
MRTEFLGTGFLLIVGGLIYYFYRKKIPLSEAAMDELERNTSSGGIQWTPYYGIFVAIMGAVFVLVGFLAK